MAEKKRKPLLDPEWEYNQAVKREELYRANAGKRLAGELWDKVVGILKKTKKSSSSSSSSSTGPSELETFGPTVKGEMQRKKSGQYERIQRAVDIAKRRRGQ